MSANQRVLVEMARRRARPGSGSSPEFLRRRTADLEWPRVDLVLSPVLCAVIGAVATRKYMPERRTGDIDVVVLSADSEKARDKLRDADYAYVGDLAIGGSSWHAPAGQEVDVIEGVESWWRDAIAEAQTNRDLQGLPTLPLAYLILIKLRASRAQDIADVSRMMGQASAEATNQILEVVGLHAPEDVPDLKSLIHLGRLEFENPGQE